MIIPARECHVCQMLTRGLRAADLAEIAATSGDEPGVALRRSLAVSERAWAALDSTGIAYAIFGVAPWPLDSNIGCPWMIATDDLYRHKRDVALYTKFFVERMGARYTALTNFVLASHRDSIRWLTYAGFSFVDFVPEHGVGKQPFLQFFKAT